MSLRRRLCALLLRGSLARCRPLGDDELGRAAMVFAPHPDDEVLGCGGTILRLRHRGAAVDVVFLTDGGRSHRGPIDRGALQRRRRAEAVRAAALLQVEPTRLHFVGGEDGRLGDDGGTARRAVAALLAERRPPQVFVPYAYDGHPDHRAAHALVHRAIQDVGLHPAVYEYAVHVWRRWPWCGRPPDDVPAGGWRRPLRDLLASLRFLGHVQRVVHIDAVVAAKRRALAAHASQLSDVLPGGPNLQRWSDGEFLAWACGDAELLRQTQAASPLC